jgi:hypothetical protein
MRPRMLILTVALGVLLAAANADAAQFTSSLGGTFNNPGSALLGTMIGNRLLADAARKGASPEGAASPARPSSPAPTARPTFTPVATNLMVRELTDILVKDAASRQALAEAFDGYLRDFDDQARRDREPRHDVGRAAAFFVMVNYFAATGREPTDAQADGAQATFRAGLIDNPSFARMADRDRQRLYESLVILGSFPIAGVAQATQAQNKEQEKMFRDFAAELVKTLIGVPVEKIRLTKSGFRIDE